MRGRRSALLVGGAVVGALMMAAASAWACTNFIRIDAVAPASAQPADVTAVRGQNAIAGSTVELRWNRTDGPAAARVQADASGAFSGEVQVPNVAPGIYVITARSQSFVARAAIEVGVAAGAQRSPVATMADSRTGSGNDPGAGMTILAVGLLLLASAAVVLSARRRPVPATVAGGPREPRQAEELVEASR